MPRALIISSDEGTRYLYQVAIAYQKIEIITAGTIKEAVAKIEKKQPDIIILDVQVSDFSDIGLLRDLKDKAGAMPLIIMADMKNSSGTKEASILGAVKYMVKGENSLGDLIKTVRRVVNK